jgi:glutathione S-transferase
VAFITKFCWIVELVVLRIDSPIKINEAIQMELYMDPITVNCRKVLAGMKLIGAPYSITKVDYFQGEQKSDAYLKINPNAKIPAMKDGDLVIWESNAILQYAADKLGSAQAYPTDLKTRADINQWLFWESNAWFPSCYCYLVENCVKPLLGDVTDQSILDTEAPNFHKLASILDARLATSRFISSDHPTIADVVIAAPMHLHVWQQLPLDDHKNLKRWMLEDIETQSWWTETHVEEGFVLPANAA